jgi:purine-binding chemotaxis protein CheW
MMATDAGMPLLVCRIGSAFLALPIASVSETMRALPIDPFAGVPEFVLGLAIVRGSATPVVDVGRLISNKSSIFARFVIARAGSRRIALAVETVVGVRSLPAHSFQELPPVFVKEAHAAVGAVGTLDMELVVLLESARLLPETVWTSLDAAEVRA